MKFGPIQLIVIGFDTIDRFKGEIMRELDAAKRRGVVRVLDLLFVMKDQAGQITALQDSDLSAAEARELGALIGKMIGLEASEISGEASALAVAEHDYGLTEEDILDLAQEIEPGTATALLVIEHVWALGFRDAVRDAGGRMLAQGFLTPDALLMVGRELEAMVEAQEAIETAEAVKGMAMLDALATVAAAEMVKEEAIKEAEETVIAAEMVKIAAVTDALQTLIEAQLIEEAAAQYALESLVTAGLIEAAAMEQAADVVAQAEAVASEAFERSGSDDDGTAGVGEPA